MPYEFLVEYAKGKEYLYANVIGRVERYDKPRDLSEFVHYKKFDWWDFGHYENKRQTELCSLTRPPQSWCYVEENDYGKRKSERD